MFVDGTRTSGKNYFSIRITVPLRIAAGVFTLRSFMRNNFDTPEDDILKLAETAEKQLILSEVRNEILEYGMRNVPIGLGKWDLWQLAAKVEMIFERRFNRDISVNDDKSNRGKSLQLVVIQGGLN